eukprot:CAMPEP_0115870994 /NCGR_PEP_ID=MMETSP0287-20121206/22628_1 /TAXON_ID=412157 /ORGANISM="Chrysochromulina rotalis, Strain UIO044" /LENGTH=790 /DNA_ID=CAMNT_0003325763 /DNA_START=282 /DNA_END=2650 /DNA_ORIENTATION=-
MLRLHELGFPDFRTLVMSQEYFKMSVLLKFLFSEKNMTEWLRPEWLKLYEPKFVDEQLIEKVLVFVPNVEALQKVLEGSMAAEAAKKEAAAEAAKALSEGKGGGGVHTTPEPFALTQPKVRLVPPPEDVIEPFKAGDVPKSTYTDPKDLVDRVELDKKKDANRVRLKGKYSNPNIQPFKLRVLERPNNLEQIKEEVQAARAAECNFEGEKAKPIPRQRPGQGIVRLNSAAILREDNLYRKKQESEAALLGAYERELRDSAEFDAWKERMKQQDEEDRLKNIEKRRMETLLTDEEAKEAKLRQEQHNRENAMAMKAEAAKSGEQRHKAEEKLQARHRAVVAEVHSQRDRPMLAKEEMERQHKRDARELRQEMEQLEAARKAERLKEEARRADLIKQIRAVELVPRTREVRLDPTYTPQLGLLEEMSLAELRERLNIVEEQRTEDEEARRAKIKVTKSEKEADLAQRAGRLSEMRERAASEAAAKRAQHKAAIRKEEEEKRERLADAQIKVKETLEQKRHQRLQKEAELAAELKRIRIKNQFLEADASAVERKKWESQLVGEQREIMERQRLTQDVAKAHLSVYDQETRQRLLNVQREREAHEAFLKEYEAHFTSERDAATAHELSIVTEQAEEAADTDYFQAHQSSRPIRLDIAEPGEVWMISALCTARAALSTSYTVVGAQGLSYTDTAGLAAVALRIRSCVTAACNRVVAPAAMHAARRPLIDTQTRNCEMLIMLRIRQSWFVCSGSLRVCHQHHGPRTTGGCKPPCPCEARLEYTVVHATLFDESFVS